MVRGALLEGAAARGGGAEAVDELLQEEGHAILELVLGRNGHLRRAARSRSYPFRGQARKDLETR